MLGIVASRQKKVPYNAVRSKIIGDTGFHPNDVSFLAEGSSGMNELRLVFSASSEVDARLDKFSKIKDKTSLSETTEMVRNTLEACHIKGHISDEIFEYRGQTYTFFKVTVGGKNMIVYFGGL